MRTLIRPGAFQDFREGWVESPANREAQVRLAPPGFALHPAVSARESLAAATHSVAASGAEVRTVCAWCPAVIVDVPVAADGRVSHGCCPVCFDRVITEADA